MKPMESSDFRADNNGMTSKKYESPTQQILDKGF